MTRPDSKKRKFHWTSLWTPSQIAALRMQLGMTQEEFAEEMGVHRITVTRWELGHLEPRLPRRVQMSHIANKCFFQRDVLHSLNAEIERRETLPGREYIDFAEADYYRYWKPGKVKALCKHMGVPPAHLARLLGSPRSRVFRWIEGTRRPDREAVERLYEIAREHGFLVEGIRANEQCADQEG